MIQFWGEIMALEICLSKPSNTFNLHPIIQSPIQHSGVGSGNTKWQSYEHKFYQEYSQV